MTDDENMLFLHAGQEDILSSFSEAIFIDVEKMPKDPFHDSQL